MRLLRTKTLSCFYNLSNDEEVVTFQTAWDDNAAIKFESGQKLQKRFSGDGADDFNIGIDVRRCPSGEKSGGLIRFDEAGAVSYTKSGNHITVFFEIEDNLFDSLLAMIRAGNIPQYVSIGVETAYEGIIDFPQKNIEGIPLFHDAAVGFEWKNRTISDKHDVKSMNFSYVLLDADEFKNHRGMYSPSTRGGSPIMSASERTYWYREQTQDLKEVKTWVKRIAVAVGAIAIFVLAKIVF